MSEKVGSIIFNGEELNPHDFNFRDFVSFRAEHAQSKFLRYFNRSLLQLSSFYVDHYFPLQKNVVIQKSVAERE